MGVPTMAARSVQISLDAQLLKEVDRQPIAKHQGRSAFIRRAIETYIELQRRRGIDEAYRRAYTGKATELEEDFGELMEAQAWPDE